MDLPKYDNSSKKGEDGFTIVKSIVEKNLNWILRKNHQENDFGIDAYIDIITELAQVTGKSIAVQLKTGDSYFKEKNDIGWIYRGELKHLNYYLNHDIPVIIIIVDDFKNKAYWCLCDGSKTEKAGENWKIVIPFSQELNKESKNELKNYISPLTDYASQLEHFWEENKLLKEHERIIFLVDRCDIEAGSYSHLLSGMLRLEVNPELLLASKGKVDIGISGYDDDPRELRDIKEVRNWVNIVFKGISGWAYYLAMDKGAQFLRVMQLCKSKFKVIEGNTSLGNGLKGNNISIDLKSGIPFLNDLFDDLNHFTERHNIPEETNKELSFKLVEYLSGYKYPPDKS